MLRVGITGGIGSGKSIACRIFSCLGIPVYDADLAAKKMMNEQVELHDELIRHFGKEVFNEEGILNRSHLAKIVFNDENQLNKLNQLVHPYVMKDYEMWTQTLNGAPYSIREAAILIESGTYYDLDCILLVEAPEELRIKRVMERDQRSRKEVKAIISRQWTSEEKKKFATFSILNDEQQALIPQVLHLHELLKLKSENKESS